MSAIFNSKYIKVAVPEAAASSILTGILGYWKLNETSGALNDEVGTLDGTAYGVTYSHTGKTNFGTALLFDGVNDYVTLPNGAQSTGTGFAYSFWFKVTALPPTNDAGLIAEYDTGLYTLMRMTVSPAGAITGYVIDSVGGKAINYAANIQTSTWYHIVLNVKGNGYGAELYLNNTLVHTGVALQSAPVHGNNIVVFGDIGNNGAYRPFNGAIDEILSMGRFLTPTEISTLYNSGAGTTYPFS